MQVQLRHHHLASCSLCVVHARPAPRMAHPRSLEARAAAAASPELKAPKLPSLVSPKSQLMTQASHKLLRNVMCHCCPCTP